MSTPTLSPTQDAGLRRFEIEGRDLGYPTEFHDGSSVAGLFVVKSRVANALIADSGFRVAEIAPGRAILALTGVHYTDTECGVYEETALAFFVRAHGGGAGIPYLSTWLDLARHRVASFTWKLQVTTKLSQQAGIQMWGFPKTVEDIDFERSGGRATVTLRMGDQEVFRYSVRAEGSQRPPTIASTVYSIFEGAPHVSTLSQTYRDAGYRLGGGELRLGEHALADELRALGVGRRPLLASWMGHLAFSMTAPKKL